MFQASHGRGTPRSALSRISAACFGRPVGGIASDYHLQQEAFGAVSKSRYSATTLTDSLNSNSAVYDVTGTVNSNDPGSLSLDQYPDIIGKVAFDPGFGHYEAYGIARFFTDRTYINGIRATTRPSAPA